MAAAMVITTSRGRKMQRINETQSFVEVYQSLHQEIENKLEIDYVYHSNFLEGSKLPKWVTRTIWRGNPVKKSRFKDKDIVVAQQQIKAIKLVRDMASILDYNISEADIKHIHSMISEHRPGQYRTNDIIDCTIPSSEIPRKMEELVDFINNKGRTFYKFRPIELAACIHYRFSQIQPFEEFNGSVARLLMNFILIKHHRPLTIIRVDDKDVP